MRIPLTIGNISIYWLQGGAFRLDGGAMFGPVPKVRWAERCKCDANNTISMVNDPLLVKTPNALMLVDTGLGNKLSEKVCRNLQVSAPRTISDQLQALGFCPEDISHVVLTHGDFDHAGGVTTIDADGVLRLTFPRAFHYVQKEEWVDMNNPGPRQHSVYLPDDFTLLQGDNLKVVEGDVQLCKEVRLRLSGGHTRGHQIVEFRSDGETAVHLGDLFPTSHHSNPLWVMAYDNFPLDVIKRKKQYFSEYGASNSWFTFYHDPDVRACRIAGEQNIKEVFR